MSIELTISSEREFNQIRMGHMTPAMAADYLKTGKLEMRPFADILRTFYPHEDLQPRLFAAFLRDDPDAVPASVARTIRNWLSGRSRPTDRADIFHIAFALGLSEANADYLLGFCTGCGIHYREGADAVFAWFLRSGKTWRDAKEFYVSLPPEPLLTMLPPTYTTGTQLTQELKRNFLKARTIDELRACYLNNLDNFGSLHLRAFHYFNRFMDQLIHPSAAWGEDREEDYSIEAVMDTYLSLHMPSGRKRQDYSTVKKLIKYNWPSATRLKNIRLRKEDVPRKLILLLYIVTENLVDGEYSEMDEDYVTMEDRLEDHWYGLNAILADCGMPMLDPRNPFDWLVLYALAADEDETMSERMEQVIDALFEDEMPATV